MIETSLPPATATISVAEFLEEWSFLLEEDGSPDKDEIVEVERYWIERGSWADSSMAALLWLTDGRYAALTSWCDTTGYGCQDGTDWYISNSRDDAIAFGLDRGSRQCLGVALPDEVEGNLVS